MFDRGDLVIRPLAASDRRWARGRLVRDWSSTYVARRGELIDATGLPGYVALLGGRRSGMALVDVRDDALEIVVLSASRRRRGVGRALVEGCVAEARHRGCRRVWLVTTNNNIGAISFYQHVGMDLCAFHRYAVRAARELKPSLPLRDEVGLPIDHELEFEIRLDA
ncbi:MAG: GNAT family N-acetyltransferase [Terrabacter sp.]